MDVQGILAVGGDVFAVACNFREGTKIVRDGARAYLGTWQAGNGNERIRIFARSRGGRWVTIWAPIRKLTNFRSTTIPVGHPMRSVDLDVECIRIHPNRASAEAHAAELMTASRREATALHVR